MSKKKLATIAAGVLTAIGAALSQCPDDPAPVPSPAPSSPTPAPTPGTTVLDDAGTP